MKTLYLCQLCSLTYEDAGKVCHPEHVRLIEGSPQRDASGRVVDCAEATTQTLRVALLCAPQRAK